MELPSCEWDENVYDSPGISTGGDLVSLALAKARVVFTSNLPENKMLTYQGNSQRPPTKVFARVAANGKVVDKNGYPPRLLANDDDLSVNNVQWSRTIMVPSAIGTLSMEPLNFKSGLDGETIGPTTAELVPPTEPDPDEPVLVIDGGAP